jgi:predicted RNA binding protein YcfA (HicA-like mRNA interferase family)
VVVGEGAGSAGGIAESGWSEKRQRGSHRVLETPGWPDFEFAFHDREEIGPAMLSRIARRTGLKPEDL